MNPGRGRPKGENKSVISVIMLRTILFPKQSVIGCEVAVCHIHVEQIRKGSYIGSRRWRIAAIGIVTAAPMPAYNPTLTLPISLHRVRG